MAFRDLLARWNRVFNLTAVRDPAQMIERHLLDSLAIAPHLQGPRCLDVGSGAGLPGLPLALALPHYRYTLLDSQSKRIRFLRQVVVELKLTNVEIVHSRVEEYHPDQRFDTVISRAFSRLREFVTLAGRLCTENGRLLAMKGGLRDEEFATLPEPWVIEAVEEYSVPGLTGARHLVRIRPGKKRGAGREQDEGQ